MYIYKVLDNQFKTGLNRAAFTYLFLSNLPSNHPTSNFAFTPTPSGMDLMSIALN